MSSELINAQTEITSVTTGSEATFQVHTTEPIHETVQTVSQLPRAVSHPLDIVLKSDILIDTLAWSTQDTAASLTLGTGKFPIRTYLIKNSIQQVLKYTQGIKATYEIIFRPIAPGTVSGGLLVYLYPRLYTDNPVPYVDAHRMYDPMQLENTSIIDASNPIDLIMELPPIHAESYQIAGSLTTGKHWELGFKVLGKLQNVVTATSPVVNVEVYVRIKEYTLHGVRTESSTVAQAAKFVKNVGEKASNALTATSDLLSVMGFSKVPLHPTMKTQPTLFHVMTSDGPDPSEIITVNTNAAITEPQERFDEMSLDYLTDHETTITYWGPSAGDRITVPICYGNYTISTFGDILTLDNYILRPFSYHRVEEFIYTIRVFSHPSVRGTLEVYYMPYIDILWVPTPSNMATAQKVIIPLEGSSETQISCPWISSNPCLPNKYVMDFSSNYSTNGQLALFLRSCSSPATSVERVRIQITYKSKGLKPLFLSDFDNKHDHALPTAPKLFCDLYADFNQIITESSKCPQMNFRKVAFGTSDNFDPFASLSGDPILSVRPLVQRPSTMAYFDIQDQSSDYTPKAVRLQAYPKIVPADPLEDSLTFNAVGFTSPTGADYTDFDSRMTLAAYYLNLYTGYKSSTRIQLNCYGGMVSAQHTGESTIYSTFEYEPPGYLGTPLITPNGTFGGATFDTAHPNNTSPYGVLAGSNTMDKSTRTTFPYNQPLPYLSPSICADEFTTSSYNNRFQYYMQPWALYLEKFKGSVNTVTYNTKLGLNILYSCGDDVKVYFYRGVPNTI